MENGRRVEEFEEGVDESASRLATPRCPVCGALAEYVEDEGIADYPVRVLSDGRWGVVSEASQENPEWRTRIDSFGRLRLVCGQYHGWWSMRVIEGKKVERPPASLVGWHVVHDDGDLVIQDEQQRRVAVLDRRARQPRHWWQAPDPAFASTLGARGGSESCSGRNERADGSAYGH